MGLARVSTGIEGLDDVLGGGFPAASTVLVAGAVGTGKTAVALRFLAAGAARGEPGLLLAAGEAPETARRHASGFAFLPPGLLRDGLLRIEGLPDVAAKGKEAQALKAEPAALAQAVVAAAQGAGARRLAVDSVTALGERLPSPPAVRSFLDRLRTGLAGLGCTALLLSEAPPRSPHYGPFGVEGFAADGVLLLGELERANDVVRTLQVVKMAGVAHSRARFLLDLSEHGVHLAPLLMRAGDGRPA